MMVLLHMSPSETDGDYLTFGIRCEYNLLVFMCDKRDTNGQSRKLHFPIGF